MVTATVEALSPDDDGQPIPAKDRMTTQERARFWAHVNHAEKPWMITATNYPVPKETS